MSASRVFTQVLLRAYRLVSDSRVLHSRWGRRAFTGAYFLYKRWVEDYYAALVREHPEFFVGGSIIDVGANIGYTSTLFASVADPHAQVYAFEPDPDNFSTLVELIERRGLHGKVVPVHAAAGESDGVIDFWRNPSSHADRRIWAQTLSAKTGAKRADVITVPLVRLDGFVARLDKPPCFIKIDVQGYELPVCLGLMNTIEACPDLKIAFEYDPVTTASQGFEPRTLLELLWSRNFFIYVITPRGRFEAVPRGSFGLAPSQPGHYWELLASRKALPAVELKI